MDVVFGDTIRAETIVQVRDVVAWANEQQRSVAVRGAGSKVALGAPVQSNVVLDLSHLAGVVAYEPAELVLTVRAGTPMREIEDLLSARGQHLAFEPPDYGVLLGSPAGLGTIGGIIAGNLSGPRRVKDGAARDHFLGFEAVSGRGEIFNAGGKVVKNVTGYDLPKLVAGSWGTLAVLTEVTVKVMPRPQISASLVISGLSDQVAAQVMSRALGSPAELSGAAHLPGNLGLPQELDLSRDEAVTVLRVDGFAPSVEARLDLLRRLLAGQGFMRILEDDLSKDLWRFVRDVGPFAAQPGSLWRLSVPPANGWQVVDAIRRDVAADFFYDWGGGLVWLHLGEGRQPGTTPSFGVALRPRGGHATLIRAFRRTALKRTDLRSRTPGIGLISQGGSKPVSIPMTCSIRADFSEAVSSEAVPSKG